MTPAPFPVTLDAALDMIDRVLGIEAMLKDQGRDRVARYYTQSRIGYDRLHSAKGCMHVALNPGGKFGSDGFLAQPRHVSKLISETGASRVLELGAGLGFNARYLARAHPGVAVTALDLLESHVAETRRRAAGEGLTNLTCVQGSFLDLPPGLGRFDVILAVETLCHATDPGRVAGQIAAHLAPGGRFVMWDPMSACPLECLTEDMSLATRLFGLGVALNQGLWCPADWTEALTRAGLNVCQTDDLTLQALPGLRVFQDRALAMTASMAGRLTLRALPRYLARNTATALTGPFVCFGPGPSPDPGQGSVRYTRIEVSGP
jgi:arsenite methyltransferase